MAEQDDETVAEGENYIEVCVGLSQWKNEVGLHILEEDFAGGGEIWRIHKNDPDPFPSKPHAHCIAGARRFVGCKLHLGTAELYKGREPLGRFLDSSQFLRLINHIRRKFPGVVLPLPPE
jgi:hypothetical protein